MRRSKGLLAVVVACAAALSACGSDARDAPAACTEGSAPILRALEAAPGAVRIGGVPPSDCLAKGSDGDQVQLVGSAFVEAASKLGDRAQRSAGGRASLQLGYLLGAARRGSARTPGIHSELLRRLEQEAAPFAGSPAFRRGERAGRRLG